MPKINNYYIRPMFLPALLANLLVFTILYYCYWLIQNDKSFYFSIVQEDNYIEWATTWAFIFASIGCVFGAVRGRIKFKDSQWFYIGLSLFCFIVAMEEISWGQRFFGYRPPNYFLENNFQQDFTVHNIMSKSFRIITLKIIILGYGIILPLLMLIPSLRRILNSLKVVAPPLELIPAFAATFYTYHVYPWEFTGEVIEFMMGLCFLFTVLFRLWDLKQTEGKSRIIGQLTTIFGAALIVIGFGFGSVNFANHNTKNTSIIQDACHLELEAIKRDFIWKSNQLNSSLIKNYSHLRLYQVVKRYEFDWMYQRQFATLTEQGLPQDRADFFIDPWNMSYWLMFNKNKTTGRVRFSIYSFGPNRKRDSDHWAIKGDDIGIILLDTGLKRPYVPENEQPF